MQTPNVEHQTPNAEAVAQAALNLARNRRALAATQPALDIPDDLAKDNWTYARDGSLAILADDGWRDGCSLPLRAARQQLKSMAVPGPVACLLDPVHGAHLRVALDNLKPNQAVLAIVLNAADLPALLAAIDLADDIAAHRLWIVAGGDWAAQLRTLFADRRGLATPMQFVRLSMPDSARLDPVIAEAQNVFREVNDDRSAIAKRLVADWRPHAGGERTAILAGSQFRLLDDAAVALGEIASGNDRCVAIDADNPVSASTLALVSAAVESGRLLTADVARGDLPDLLPIDLPWRTWVTTPRIPNAAAAGPNDKLLVADPAWRDKAIAAGWRDDAVEVADWPTSRLESPVAPGNVIAVFADIKPLDAPEKLEEFSSHLLLWNSIRQELTENPLAAGDDADAWLAGRMRHYGVNDASLDRRLFVRDLIFPAAAVGIARSLLKHGVPLHLHGTGWDAFADLRQAATGAVISRREFSFAAASSAAILDIRPVNWRNALHTQYRPVIRTAGRTFAAIRHDISLALAGRLQPPPRLPPLKP